MATPMLGSILKNRIRPNFHLFSMRAKLDDSDRADILHSQDIEYVTVFECMRLITEEERVQFHIQNKPYEVLREMNGKPYSAYVRIAIGALSDETVAAMHFVVDAYRETEKSLKHE